MVALSESREAGSQWAHFDAAGTYEIPEATQLIRVVINTSVDPSTVTVQDGIGLGAATLAVIDGAERDIGVVYHAKVSGLTLILDDDLDVTVLFD